VENLEELGDEEEVKNREKMGIKTERVLGISITDLRELAKEIGTDHELAKELWKTKIHEARILASMIDNPEEVTEEQMDNWVEGIDSWDLCDQCCNNLFIETEFAEKRVKEWSYRDEEFVKRAAFSLIAYMAIHREDVDNEELEKFLDIIERGSTDGRKYVKKAVNWALREIGKKRNKEMNEKSIEKAEEIKSKGSKTAEWIGKNALKELKSEKVQGRFNS